MTAYRVEVRVDGGDWSPCETFADRGVAQEHVDQVERAIYSAGTPPVAIEYRIVEIDKTPNQVPSE